MVGCMNQPIVIYDVLPRNEIDILYQYFDRKSPAINSLATWTYNNASYGKGDPISWQHPLRTDLISDTTAFFLSSFALFIFRVI